MEEIRNTAKVLCILSGGICLIGVLVSGTKFKSQINLIMSLIFSLVIITSVTGISISESFFDLEEYFPEITETAEEKYNNELKEAVSANISGVLREQIEAAGIKCMKIETEVNISDSGSISINRVTINTEDNAKAEEIITGSLGNETEVKFGNTGYD